jgi:integrating conjugative element protein (TIGR03759 family)
MTDRTAHGFHNPALVWALLGALFFPPLWADELNRSDTGIDTLERSSLNVEVMGFDGWGLTDEEVARYNRIMEGPRGNWTPNLDPIQVLGINAQTEAERRIYAERQAQIEHDRILRERHYEEVYLMAWHRLYPNEQLYKMPPPITQNPQQADPYRKIVKVVLPCDPESPCFKRISPDLKNAAARPVDLYFFGMKSVDDIQAWAHTVGIDPETVRARVITLNLGEELSK